MVAFVTGPGYSHPSPHHYRNRQLVYMLRHTQLSLIYLPFHELCLLFTSFLWISLPFLLHGHGAERKIRKKKRRLCLRNDTVAKKKAAFCP